MNQVDEVHWFPNHGPVSPAPLVRLGLLYHAAARFVPNSLMLPDGSGLTALPGAPEGSCSDIRTAPSSLPSCHSTLGVLSWTGLEQVESSALAEQGRVSVSDPERLAGSGSGVGRPARGPVSYRLGTRFCSGFESSGRSWRGVGGGVSLSVPARVGFPGSLLSTVREPRARVPGLLDESVESLTPGK